MNLWTVHNETLIRHSSSFCSRAIETGTFHEGSSQTSSWQNVWKLRMQKSHTFSREYLYKFYSKFILIEHWNPSYHFQIPSNVSPRNVPRPFHRLCPWVDVQAVEVTATNNPFGCCSPSTLRQQAHGPARTQRQKPDAEIFQCHRTDGFGLWNDWHGEISKYITCKSDCFQRQHFKLNTKSFFAVATRLKTLKSQSPKSQRMYITRGNSHL